jgi:hypothetical protein
MQVPLKIFAGLQGLIAASPLPQGIYVHPGNLVGASLLAMGSSTAPQIQRIYTLRMTVAH